MSKAKPYKIQNDPEDPFEGREGLIYARVSSKRQETEGSGLGSQEGRCVSYLKTMGISQPKSFLDSYSGGGDFMQRPAMRALLNYIDNSPHKKFVVVFDDLSRFARDVFFHIKLRAEFRKRDVVLKCLNYNFDESEEGEFAELIFAGKAELDRKQNRRQVIQKQRARLELGYWSFGAKRGYEIVKDPEHGKISKPTKEGLGVLKDVLEGFANGIFVHKVDACRFLVEQGFWKKQKPERYIDKLTNYILTDPFYAGYIEYPAWEVSRRIGKHEGIISIETFELIQKRLRRVDSGKRIRIDVSDDFPLRGLLICADCEKHMTGGWITNGKGGKFARYYCQNRDCSSYGKVIKKDVIEGDFLKILKNNTLKKDVSKLVETVFDRVWDEEVKNIGNNQKKLASHKDSLARKIEELTVLMLNTHTEVLRRTYERQIENYSEEYEANETKLLG